MKNKVAIYLRKSREDEELKEETLVRHETMLLEYCARNNLTILEIYKEIVSGDSIANRPEMQRLLDDVAQGLYDGVVCIEIERLSRGNQVDQCEILDVFKSSKTKIYTLNKIYDLSKEEIDEEYFEFALFMSRREYKTITRRLTRGKKQARRDGYFTASTIPYGFTKERVDGGYILVPDPDESEIIKLIFEKYINGVGTYKIASYLNSKGIKTRRGREWQDFTILSTVTNKTYAGYIYSNKYDEWVDGKHEPLIDALTFARAQEIRRNTTRCKRDVKTQNPLASIGKCGLCGFAIHHGKSSRGVPYLKCKNVNCKNRSAKLEYIEDKLISELKETLKDFNYFIENYEGEMIKKRKELKREIELLNKELKKKEKMLETACEMLEKGIYTVELFIKRTSSIESDIKEIKERIASINATPLDEDKTIKKAIPILDKIINNYHKLEPKEKNILLKSLVERIEYTRIEDEIELKITTLV